MLAEHALYESSLMDLFYLEAQRSDIDWIQPTNYLINLQIGLHTPVYVFYSADNEISIKI